MSIEPVDRQRLAVGARGLALVLLAATLIQCSAPEETDYAPGPTPPAETPTPPDESDASGLEAFRKSCEAGVREWRAGQLDYPETLTIEMPEPVTYSAAIDVRDAPLPPEEVIDADDGAASQDIVVQCHVGARLVPVGDALTVDDGGDGEEWTYRTWSPSGVMEWSWTVTAVDPVDSQLRLDLRPAVVAEDLNRASETEVSVTTEVDVEASWIRSLAHWRETEGVIFWGMVVAALGGVGFLLAWFRNNLKRKA